MKELRSLVNALLLFAIFLIAYAFVVPGSVRSGTHGPRFFKMEIDDRGHSGRTEKVRICVPYFLYRGGLSLASTGKLRREMDLHFDEPVEADILREVWTELGGKPEGTVVSRKSGSSDLEFTRQGAEIVLMVYERRETGEGTGEAARDECLTLRFPARFLEALVGRDRALDVGALIDELKKASRGDVVDLRTGEAHVHVTIE